ncbi:serine/threonine protein phosphatase-like protein [Leptotrichia trevisanii]|uniref:Serine/threonine protein phosphatase-like protein n=1 Tax=Leptotrichia trevisanii TaxID=109328 RepID=A0A510KZN6_9FUSO|nr:PP2C family serine/threonine-protein phosphatase [Leptotrichia trevisanii]BBM44208.1 serine/threonine protein phosphatase-like protein [Leptotrichia trevisanii]BBM51355.1 serine/threonine protein phosphatase-like protein [Leptotrichia trevisanii]BBM56271.1 serine/threonine protein phosphatase-like protein [Leptotrichia trevisanii]
MDEKKSKYVTYFFKNYAGIAEKNTYSTYIPEKDKGFWCLIVDNDKYENFAKIGVEEAVRYFFENKEFSQENATNILNIAYKKIIERKLMKNKKKGKISILVVLVSENKMMVSNIGDTRLKLFRENMIVEDILRDENKTIQLLKDDYALLGTPKFWKTINDNNISDALIRWNSKIEIEKSISEKIEEVEKLDRMTIPFMSIFAERIVEEEEIIIIERQEQGNPLKYFLLMLIFSFTFIAINKTLVLKKYENEAQKHFDIAEKYYKEEDYNNSVKEINVALDWYSKIKPQSKKITKKIEELIYKKKLANINEQKLFTKVEQSKVIEQSEPIVKTAEIVITPEEETTPNLEINKQNTEIHKPKIIKKRVRSKKKSHQKSNVNIYKKRKKEKKTLVRNDDLNQEIKRNWKILGRDDNGNKV